VCLDFAKDAYFPIDLAVLDLAEDCILCGLVNLGKPRMGEENLRYALDLVYILVVGLDSYCHEMALVISCTLFSRNSLWES